MRDIADEQADIMREANAIERRKLQVMEDYVTWQKQQSLSPALSPIIKF
jgi:hypothetical protein